MRSKEDAQDYRYFGDPDLVEINLDDLYIEQIRNTLPELPTNRFKRYTNKFGIPEKDALLIVKYKNVSDFFEAASAGLKNPKAVSNFIIGQIFRNIETETEREKFEILVSPKQLHELVKLIEDGKINMNLAKKTFSKMLESGKDVTDFISEDDMKGISDNEIEALCREAVSKNEAAAKDYLSGKEKAIKAILGYVMKATKGKGDALKIEKKLVEIINQ